MSKQVQTTGQEAAQSTQFDHVGFLLQFTIVMAVTSLGCIGSLVVWAPTDSYVLLCVFAGMLLGEFFVTVLSIIGQRRYTQGKT
jgi:hypothetical protein